MSEERVGGAVRTIEEVVERYYEPVYRYHRKRCATPEEAEDLAQETFLRVYTSLESFKGRSTLPTLS